MDPFSTKSTIIITCPKRISSYLRQEVENLNFPIVSEEKMGIETSGTLNDCILLNLQLRTAHRVLYFLKKFRAKNPDELYKEINQIEWENYIHIDGYFSVISYADNPAINNTTFASLKFKDAVVDRFDQKFGSRPNSGPDKHKAVIYLYWKEETASVYIDSSGDNIAKHGYRKIPYKAPLQESLAAAMIIASGWDTQTHFINPMCGSGTLAIEAAMRATHRAPGLLRSNFGFMHIKGFDENIYGQLRTEARIKSKKTISGKIIASDNSELALEAAKKNATTAGVDHLIDFQLCDFRETLIPTGPGAVILNPEYGERLGDERDLEETYKNIGDFFKQSCKGKIGLVFTGNLNLAKKIGLKPKRKIEFYNSTIDCRLMVYELYEGTRKTRPEEIIN